MATATFTVAPNGATAAEFRLWGSQLSAAFAAVGLVKTADTGQIDWVTVGAPGINSTVGYEVWRFNDALQGSYPIYFRIEYGGGNPAASPAYYVLVGKGSNGSGTLTGSLANGTFWGGGADSLGFGNAAATPWYVSSGDGSMLVVSTAPAFVGTSSHGNLWFIERSRNAAGVATGVGMVLATQRQGNPPAVLIRNYALASGMDLTMWPAVVPCVVTGPASVAGTGTTAPLFPAIVGDSKGNIWQPRAILSYASLDIGQFAAIAVPGFNTYLPLGMGGNCYNATAGKYGQAAMAWW